MRAPALVAESWRGQVQLVDELEELRAPMVFAQQTVEALGGVFGARSPIGVRVIAVPDDDRGRHRSAHELATAGLDPLLPDPKALAARAQAHAKSNPDPLGIGKAVTSDATQEWSHSIVEGRAYHHAVQTWLGALPDQSTRHREASLGVRRAGCVLVVVLDMAEADWGAADRVGQVDHSGTLYSLMRAATREFLATTSAQFKDYTDKDPASGGWYQEVLRDAALSLMDLGRLSHSHHTLFDAANAVAAMQHEGKATHGALVVAGRAEVDALHAIPLALPVPLEEHAALRKLLTASSQRRPLVCDEDGVHALAGEPVNDAYGWVRFRSGAQWEFAVSGVRMFRVQGGQVSLPLQNPTQTALRARWSQVLCQGDAAKCWPLLKALFKAPKGGVLVIARDAASEAERLSEVCFAFKRAVELDGELLSDLMSMDGAVLIDTDGRLHAAGVILDGEHVAGGQRTRGARFNQTKRYVGRRPGVLAVVKSEDGQVDLFP